MHVRTILALWDAGAMEVTQKDWWNILANGLTPPSLGTMGDPSPRSSADTVLVSYGANPLRVVSEQLLAEAQPSPIDLSNTVVLLPHQGAVPRFRRVLLDAASDLGFPALLPPYVGAHPRCMATKLHRQQT